MDKMDQRTKTRGEVAARCEREREAVVEKLPVAEGMEASVARESAPQSSPAYNYLFQLPDLSLVSPS